MTGAKKEVFAFCKAKHPNIFLSGCTLHLVYITAEKGADSLPVPVSEILADVFYYFSSRKAPQRSIAWLSSMKCTMLSSKKCSSTSAPDGWALGDASSVCWRTGMLWKLSRKNRRLRQTEGVLPLRREWTVPFSFSSRWWTASTASSCITQTKCSMECCWAFNPANPKSIHCSEVWTSCCWT